MQKLKIRLPATVTNLGPGINSLGLALSLYTTVEISGRSDSELHIIVSGEGASQFDVALRHPVVLAMARFFQQIEQTYMGINVRIDNQIPLNSGLGAETAFTVAGVLGANSLMESRFPRDELLRIAATINRPDGVAAALRGGLTVSALDDDALIYRSLAITGFQVVVVVPEIADYAAPFLPEQLPRRDALFNLSRLPLLIEALRSGDMALLVRMLDDRVYRPRLTEAIEGYRPAVETATNLGALAVTTCGDGPALMAFAHQQHQRIGEAMVQVFKDVGHDARYWVLPVDTQGVVISAVQSS